MNELIKHLAIQAGFNLHNDPFDGHSLDHEIAKFSELIVKEAIGVLQKRFMGDLNREDMEVRRCIDDVKKRFGVI